MHGELWTRIYLVRHGEVDAAWRGRLYGNLDVPLSDEGRRQAEDAAERLADRPLAAVVSSDLERARYGARRIAERARAAPPLDVDRRWRELSRGAWAGATFAELEQRAPGAFAAWLSDPERVRPPDGESLADVAARVGPALEGLAARAPGSEVAVVAHGWVLRVVLARCLGLTGAAISRLVVPPASIAALDWPLHARFADALAVGASAVGDPQGGGGESPPPRPVLAGLGLDAPPALRPR